jgi:hypothetical protein
MLAAVAVTVAAAGGILWWRSRAGGGASTAPKAPPRAAAPAGASRPAALPALPSGADERNRTMSRAPAGLQTHEVGIQTYADAVAAGEKNPGEKAFRADALAFFEFNGDLGEEKAAKEGVTLDELKELTYMGLLAMHVRRWDAVERLTGRELSPEEQVKGDELVFSASNALKAAIREHVAKGDAPEARWETIRKHQASFIEQYKALVKISPEDYDRLLAVPFLPRGG